MSFAGHVFDMINRAKYNRALLQSYRDRHRQLREALYIEHKKREIHQLKFKEIPVEEREKIRLEIRRTIIRERRIALIKTWTLTLIVFAGLTFIVLRYFLKIL